MPDPISINFTMFFDRAAVKKKVKDGTQSALSKAGAYIRTSAKSSIKKAVSAKTAERRRAKGLANDGTTGTPGGPPRSHTGKLKDLIIFGYDDRSESVVVGPMIFKRRTPTAPQLLEFGGRTTTDKGKPAIYRRFPFMRPALEKNLNLIPQQFEGCVK